MIERIDIRRPTDARRWTEVWNAFGPDRPMSPEETLRSAEHERRHDHWILHDAGRPAGVLLLRQTRWRSETVPPEVDLGIAPELVSEDLIMAMLCTAAHRAIEWGFVELRVHRHSAEQDEALHNILGALGFRCTEVDVEARLDVAVAQVWDAALPAGLRMTDLEREPQLRPSAHRCFSLADRDDPSDDPAAELSFDEWSAQLMLWGTWADCLVAVDAEGTVVGWSSLERESMRPDRAWNGFTGTHPDHRERGIASALKHALIAHAAATGVTAILTENIEGNAPMRHINDRLGYVASHQHESWRGPVSALVPEPGRDPGRPT